MYRYLILFCWISAALGKSMDLRFEPRNQSTERTLPLRYIWDIFLVPAPRLVGFSWDQCGDPSDLVQVKYLSVSPTGALHFPGEVTVSFEASLSRGLSSPIQAEIFIKKHETHHFSDDDVCEKLEQLKCPSNSTNHGIDCHCPFKAGTYTLSPTPVELPHLRIPHVFLRGHYNLKAEFTHIGQQALCLEASFEIA